MPTEQFNKGDYFGIEVICTPTYKYTSKEIKKFFSQFAFQYVAKSICELTKNFLHENNIAYYEDVPYSNDTLCKAFYLAIKYANNSIQKENIAPSKVGLKKILQIANGENDKNFKLMTSINQQFCENYTNQIARTWCIFHELWPLSYGESPIQMIEKMINVPYTMVLGFSWSIINSGYTFECKDYKEFEQKLGVRVNEKWCENYLNYFSCSRNQWLLNSCPPTYISKPILDSGITPSGHNSKLYFIPSAKNLISRITTGLFYDLADKYKEKKTNKFRSQFGKIFEQYVSKLFKEYLNDSFLQSNEIEYGTKHRSQRTTDMLIRRGDSLILLEIKQANLYAKALYEGDENDIKEDLRRNIGEAVVELDETESALNKKHKKLEQFCGCSKIYKLIVFNNPLHLANNFCKSLLKEEMDLSNISIINIYELETLLDIQQSEQNIFEMLELKEKKYPNYSYKDFMAHAYPNAEKNGTFINRYLNEIFAAIKLNN